MNGLMTRIPVALVALASIGAWAQAQAPSVDPAGPKYRVVMQVSNAEPRGWHQTLANAMALTKNAGPQNVQIEIVAMAWVSGCSNTTRPKPGKWLPYWAWGSRFWLAARP